MSRAILLCGADAKTPYRFFNPDVSVYNIEELCYVLRENAFLLDADMADKRLAAWIDTECGLHDLATALLPLAYPKGNMAAFVMTILEYTGNYSQEELEETERLLKQGAQLGVYEKYKIRIDNLVENGKLVQAMTEYDELAAILPQVENELTAKVLHNKAVAMAGLALYEQAARCFLQSYEMCPDRETYVEYLAAKRLALGEEDYISFVAEIPEAYEDSMELEKRVEKSRLEFDASVPKQHLEQLQEWKGNGNFTRYSTEVEKIIQGLKQNYRHNIGEV